MLHLKLTESAPDLVAAFVLVFPEKGCVCPMNVSKNIRNRTQASGKREPEFLNMVFSRQEKFFTE